MKSATIPKYFPKDIEAKWQAKWKEEKLNKFEYKPEKGKYYVLVELPYPSGNLHIGHWFTFITPDVLARFKRMMGENVFFPMGFDAIGLPAENAAIKNGLHPKDWTYKNIETMTAQFQQMGTMIDWDRVTITADDSYMHWNQWIFLEMYKRGIAYRSKTLSNWCPKDQTVLANEHVENGKCWRCGEEVVQKEVEQWFLRITEYADKLLWDNTKEKLSNGVEWPQSVREGQNNWIGKSAGALVKFQIPSFKSQLEVFTTRPDTLFGATFMVVSPEHEILKQVQDDKVSDYIVAASKKTELERKENKEKTGVFSGIYAINPVNNEKIPVWVSDYVLAGYGTGALMAVPAHDERDFAFATKFDLPIKAVISTGTELPYAGDGKLVDSGAWTGWEVPASMDKIISWLEEKGIASKKIIYHLHDWSVSRQRYWGTPVPIINCPKDGAVPVPEKDLPVLLPYDVDYTPKGKPPLASNEEWFNTTCPKCGGKATRDAETLDTFFDSSWYYFRYTDPTYDKGPFDGEKVKQLMPLDIYFGGAEHTLGHTLYARFYTKFFKDLGLVDFDEFAKKRIQHGIVLGPDGEKMSKSKGNVINPDDVVKEFGTDAVRLYLSFMMPYEATGPWSTTAMYGMFRFLRRVWDLRQKVGEGDVSKNDLYEMHRAIKKVSGDIESIKMNTAVAAIMEWLNHVSSKEVVTKEEYKTMLLLLSPFAPYITEELWHVVGEKESIHRQVFPQADEKYLIADTMTVVVQINGKMRDSIMVASNEVGDQKTVETIAKKSEKAAKFLDGQVIKKIIYIPGKIVNFVV